MQKSLTHILLIEDNAADPRLMVEILTEAGAGSYPNYSFWTVNQSILRPALESAFSHPMAIMENAPKDRRSGHISGATKGQWFLDP
jgi:CheY-like chemotaxis protein